jgi:soluble lytic murein transglycosylase
MKKLFVFLKASTELWGLAALPPDVRKVSDFPKGLHQNPLRLRRHKGRSPEISGKSFTARRSHRRTSDGTAVTQILVGALVFLFIAFSFSIANAQTPNERHQRIRNAVDNRDAQTAIAELIAFRSADASIFSLNNYDYLLARFSQQRGDKATASANYHAIIKRNSILTQYALWHLAEISRMTGNLNLEREQLRQLLSNAQDSLLREPASMRLAQSLFESGEYESAIQILKPMADSKLSSASRKTLLLLGQSYLKSKQNDLARETFTKLITETTPDDYALEAAKSLDAMDGGKQTEAPQLTDPEHLRRALIYQFNRDFANARLHYNAIVTRYPESPNVPDALFQIGRGFAQERNYNDAIQPLQKVIADFPDKLSARDATNLLASCYGRLKRFDESIATYKQAIEKFPNADNPERPYLNIIDALRDAGRDDEALQWAEQTRERFKGQMPSALALFSQLKIHFTQSAWEKVLSDCDLLKTENDLGGLRVAGSTTQKEIAFMQAYAFEQLGRVEEAINAYLAITDGRNEYYGWQATARLQAMISNPTFAPSIAARFAKLTAEAEQAINNNQAETARVAATNAIRLMKDDKARKTLLEIIKRAYSQFPAYNNLPTNQLQQVGRQEQISNAQQQTKTLTHKSLADELLFLSLYDEAALELDYALKKEQTTSLTNDMAFTLAVMNKRGNHADKAVAYIEPLWRNVPADYLLELAPRESVELLYPTPYKESLLKYAASKKVDPRFVLSIMRQESRYKPDIKSVAAARGLMQFISATSTQIATQLGKKHFKQDDLYNPDVAIEFGSQYLANLFQMFPNSPQAVAASYNGGEDNMARWIARARSNEVVRYVPEIVFAQSKDYVYKVLANYRVYQILYDERLNRR